MREGNDSKFKLNIISVPMIDHAYKGIYASIIIFIAYVSGFFEERRNAMKNVFYYPPIVKIEDL